MAVRFVAVILAVLGGCSTVHEHAEQTARGGRPVLSYGYALLYEMVQRRFDAEYADALALLERHYFR